MYNTVLVVGRGGMADGEKSKNKIEGNYEIEKRKRGENCTMNGVKVIKIVSFWVISLPHLCTPRNKLNLKGEGMIERHNIYLPLIRYIFFMRSF